MSGVISYRVIAIAPLNIGGRTIPRGRVFDFGCVERSEDLTLVHAAYANIHPHLAVLKIDDVTPPAPPRDDSAPVADDAPAALEKIPVTKTTTHKNMKHG